MTPFRFAPRRPSGDFLSAHLEQPYRLATHIIQRIAEEHEHPPEEEKAEKRYASHSRKSIPVRLRRPVLVKVADLHPKVARHEADGQEEDTKFC